MLEKYRKSEIPILLIRFILFSLDMRKLKDNEVRIVFYDNISIIFTLNRYEMEAVKTKIKTKKKSELEDYIVKICNIKYDKGDYILD